MIRADFHTHTCRDHAHGTPAEMAAEAARMGMSALGMVGHAQMEFFCDYAMTPEAERTFLAEMDAETFALYLRYHFATCERQDMIGYSNHTLDIFRKESLC